jgi:hypothetical protein
MDYCVFIHTNQKQIVGALVSAWSMRRNSAHGDRFKVRIVYHNDYPLMHAREGQLYLRDGVKRRWLNNDLQAFTPLRFTPPGLMNYTGRAVVVDPDVFAVGDVWELLTRDMQDKGILCRTRSSRRGTTRGCLATSVMLLDCARLTHWKFAEQFDEMFEFRRDYKRWICLRTESRHAIGLIGPEWNSFDRLDETTRMLHNTRRRTQPWKTGLPVDFRPPETFRWLPPRGWVQRVRRTLFGEYGLMGHYRPHPDPGQERYFFGLLRECLERNIVTEDMLREQMRRNHVRHDALEVLDRTPPLAPAAGAA